MTLIFYKTEFKNLVYLNNILIVYLTYCCLFLASVFYQLVKKCLNFKLKIQ